MKQNIRNPVSALRLLKPTDLRQAKTLIAQPEPRVESPGLCPASPDITRTKGGSTAKTTIFHASEILQGQFAAFPFSQFLGMCRTVHPAFLGGISLGPRPAPARIQRKWLLKTPRVFTP